MKSVASIVNALNRAGFAALDRLILTVDKAYNYLLVRFVNGLIQSIIRTANTVRRVVIKSVLHLMRVVRRILYTNKWVVKWLLDVGRSYAKVFVVFPLLVWFGATLLFLACTQFYEYIHGGPLYLPFTIFLLGAAVLAIMPMAVKQLLQVSMADFGEKALNATAIFGLYSFLTVLVTSWLLGVAGTVLSQGPYRLGWVTITSTVILIAVIVIAQRRFASEPSPEQQPSVQDAVNPSNGYQI